MLVLVLVHVHEHLLVLVRVLVNRHWPVVVDRYILPLHAAAAAAAVAVAVRMEMLLLLLVKFVLLLQTLYSTRSSHFGVFYSMRGYLLYY